jgi:hypothetical protein
VRSDVVRGPCEPAGGGDVVARCGTGDEDVVTAVAVESVGSHRQTREAPKFAALIAEPSEFWVRAAVIVELAFGPDHRAGLADAVNTNRGDTVEPPDSVPHAAVRLRGMRVRVLLSARTGVIPHQLFVASAEPDSTENASPGELRPLPGWHRPTGSQACGVPTRAQ